MYEFIVTDILFVRIEFARGMLANKEDWNKLVMAAKMVSDPNIQVLEEGGNSETYFTFVRLPGPQAFR